MKKISLLAIFIIGVLLCMPATAFAQEVYEFTMSGRDLTQEEVQALEKQIKENPDDINLRTKLLGYCFNHRIYNKSARELQRNHILWLINNSPEAEVLSIPEGQIDLHFDPEGYLQGKKAWLEQLKNKPNNPKVFGNSANFFMFEDKELAEQSLQKACFLDPKNPKWPDRLGHLYSGRRIEADSLQEITDYSVKALEQFEISYKLTTDKEEQDALLKRLAETAFTANQHEKAKKYAERMLNHNHPGWNYGNNIHHGNLILGRAALRLGNIEEAKEHLLKAGQTPGSPQLNSFGPSMNLAKELLEKGEKEVVLEYFELCSKFWKMDRDRLDEWAVLVKGGRIPDFGNTLDY